MRYRDFDEESIRSRPSRRGSRPRTKRRPAHEDAVPGMVIGVDRGRYAVLLTDVGAHHETITAIKARDLGRRALVVGDNVALVGDVSGKPDTLARIVRLEKRRTTLRRTADDDDPYERVVVANADQMVIVTALADPEPRQRMVDRCLVAAFDAEMDVLLCLTKADLASPEEFLAPYANLNVSVVTTSLKSDGTIAGLDTLQSQLSGLTSAFVGHSGVGKSTLVNALVPDAERETGSVNVTTGRGRHTSTSALAFELPGPEGGWVIDTPGIRSFGLAHIDPDRIISGFPDLAPAVNDCPRGCTHDDDAIGCALDPWVEAGKAGEHGRARLESLRRVLGSRRDTEY